MMLSPVFLTFDAWLSCLPKVVCFTNLCSRSIHLTRVLLCFGICAGLTLSGCQHHSAREFISVEAPLIALTHLRILDGTGAPAKQDQTIIIEAGRIKAIDRSPSIIIPQNSKILDLN